MSLAFIAALQELPPRERAALVLSDALDFCASEVAEILECEPAEVDDLLRHARAMVTGVLPRPAPDEDAVVSRFTGAFERGDMSGMTELLARDAWLRMRPIPVEYQGRRAARHFLAVVAFPGGTPSYRLVATRANGQPAFGCYLRDPATGIDRACGLIVLTVDGGRIAAIDRFVDNSVLPRFGLPRTLSEQPPAPDLPPLPETARLWGAEKPATAHSARNAGFTPFLPRFAATVRRCWLIARPVRPDSGSPVRSGQVRSGYFNFRFRQIRHCLAGAPTYRTFRAHLWSPAKQSSPALPSHLAGMARPATLE